MKIQSILKQYGGADIKLKTEKIKSILSVIGKIGLAIAIFFVVYKIGEWIFDVLLNGFIGDWVWHNLMEQQTVWVDAESGTAQIVQPYWPAIRSFIMTVAVVLIFMMGGGICLACYLYGKRQRKKEIQKISRIIGIYMENDVKTGSLFEAEYAPVETQLVSIKARMQHHEQLIRAEAAKKNDLITYLAHDLKTPLTSVVGYLSLLDEVRDMPDAQREKYTHVALEKSERLEKLINEFFEITRYNLTHIVLEKETINLYYMIIQMTDEFYPILQAHGNTISVEADENLEIYADSEKLARVFNNILKNAVAYSYEKTNICVTAKRTADDFIEIRFTNHGRTIPTQKLQSIFDKFFRLDESRTTNSGGAGLGLAIAREIIRLHEGQISAKSADEMTTFEIKLPCTVKNNDSKVTGE